MLHQEGFIGVCYAQGGHLNRNVRNKPNQLLRTLAVEGWPKFDLYTARTKKQYLYKSFIGCPRSLWNEYCKVASSNTSRLEAQAGFFRLLMKETIQYIYVSASKVVLEG